MTETTTGSTATRAADLPPGSVVATRTVAGVKQEVHGEMEYPWKMTNGGRYADKHVDEMFAVGAAVLRVGP